MQSCTIISIISIIVLLCLASTWELEPFETIRIAHEGDNKYQKICGACLPSSDNPNIYEKQCVIKNTSEGYPLVVYTSTETCGECVDIGNGIRTCSTQNGVTNENIGWNFCSS